VEENVDEQPGSAVAHGEVDVVVHGEDFVHAVALCVVGADLVTARREQDNLAAPGGAERDDGELLLVELLADRSR
jgi:hypothetical protein